MMDYLLLIEFALVETEYLLSFLTPQPQLLPHGED